MTSETPRPDPETAKHDFAYKQFVNALDRILTAHDGEVLEAKRGAKTFSSRTLIVPLNEELLIGYFGDEKIHFQHLGISRFHGATIKKWPLDAMVSCIPREHTSSSGQPTHFMNMALLHNGQDPRIFAGSFPVPSLQFEEPTPQVLIQRFQLPSLTALDSSKPEHSKGYYELLPESAFSLFKSIITARSSRDESIV